MIKNLKIVEHTAVSSDDEFYIVVEGDTRQYRGTCQVLRRADMPLSTFRGLRKMLRDFVQGVQQAEEANARLARIAQIIEGVDQRCMAADGPVTPTLQEMTQSEISEIYHLASKPQKR